MDIFRVIGFGIVCAVLLVMLRRERPELAVLAGLAAGLFLFYLVLPALTSALNLFWELAAGSRLNPGHFGTVMKVLAVSYVADFGASVCRDAGEETIAQRVEMAGKVIVLALSVPLLRGILDVISSLLS